MRRAFRQGMTMIELIVVLAVIGILVAITAVTFLDVREQNRDTVRLSDISQIEAALRAYKRDVGTYPTLLTAGAELKASSTVYLAAVPTPPSPSDGSCANYPLYATYYYSLSVDTKSYCLSFCLGGQTSDLTAGAKFLLPTGIIDTAFDNTSCL